MQEHSHTARRLYADETVQKYLISTTSRLLGEFESDDVLIRHAWPGFHDHSAQGRILEGPTSRSAYVLIFGTPEYEKAPGVPIPNYNYVGESICAYLSVLYGKRFDNHGPLETTGFHNVPDIGPFNSLSLPGIPQNTHKPRVDLGFALNLTEFKRFQPLLNESVPDHARLVAFSGASHFYTRALQAAERDPEVAYLHLITAAEILANSLPTSQGDLLDSDIKAALSRIESELADGERVANLFRARLRQIKRRFLKLISDLVDPSFFGRTEASEPYGAFKAETFTKAMAAAYDLRSRFIHTGVTFGKRV
jgi:hypothetical protein